VQCYFSGVFRVSVGSKKKKLEGAASFWAKGGVQDEAPSDLESFGAPAELIEQIKSQSQDEAVFEVDPDNWETLMTFLLVQTQWVVSSSGSILGLNYQSVDFVFKMYEVAKPREIFDGLRIMEAEIMRIKNSEKKA
jgi:hypothetical protein